MWATDDDCEWSKNRGWNSVCKFVSREWLIVFAVDWLSKISDKCSSKLRAVIMCQVIIINLTHPLWFGVVYWRSVAIVQLSIFILRLSLVCNRIQPFEKYCFFFFYSWTRNVCVQWHHMKIRNRYARMTTFYKWEIRCFVMMEKKWNQYECLNMLQ